MRPSPLRVTHSITRLIVGGAQENTLATVLGLREKPKLKVQLISGPTAGTEGSLEPEASRVEGLLHINPHLIRPLAPVNDWLAYRWLVRHFQRDRPHIVHTHSGKAGYLGRRAAHAAGVPLILHTIHGPSFGPFQGAVANQIFLRAERHAGRVTKHFISVADAMTRQYLAAGIGTGDQYTTIHSGFDLEPYRTANNDPQLRASLQLAPEHIVVGKIARLFKLKGHEELFEAAPKIIEAVPHVRFLLVGDGPLRSVFEQQLAERGLRDYFRFTGLVPPQEVAHYVGIMDLLVHLSRREGLARALPQAMAAGKPVIAAECDGAPEVCLPEKTGLLVTPGDTRALCRAVIRLARSRDERAALGRNGHSLALERFSAQHMVDRIHELYLRLLDEPNMPAQ